MLCFREEAPQRVRLPRLGGQQKRFPLFAIFWALACRDQPVVKYVARLYSAMKTEDVTVAVSREGEPGAVFLQSLWLNDAATFGKKGKLVDGRWMTWFVSELFAVRPPDGVTLRPKDIKHPKHGMSVLKMDDDDATSFLSEPCVPVGSDGLQVPLQAPMSTFRQAQDTIVTFEVPVAMVRHFSAGVSRLCSPQLYHNGCTNVRVDLDSPLVNPSGCATPVVDQPGSVASGSAAGTPVRAPVDPVEPPPVDNLARYRARGTGTQPTAVDGWGPLMHIAIVRLTMRLSNHKEMAEVVREAGTILCPEKDFSAFRLPGRELVRTNTVKVDCLNMLLCRHLAASNTSRVCRHLIPDSSPQGNRDYFICIEDRYTRIVQSTFDPLGGFVWERRRMPLACIGHRQGSAVSKSGKLLHMAILENGIPQLPQWRRETRGITTEQGTESKVEKLPFGDADVMKESVESLLAGLPLRSPAARSMYLFSHALSTPCQVGYISFEGEGTEALQLRAYRADRQADLHRFPELFVEVQELSLLKCSARIVEAEHKQVKISTLRGFAVARPGTTCARERAEQNNKSLAVPENLAWVCRQWNSKFMWRALLAHLFNASQVDRMTLAEKWSHVYQYATASTFKDLTLLPQATRRGGKCCWKERTYRWRMLPRRTLAFYSTRMSSRSSPRSHSPLSLCRSCAQTL